MDAALAEGGDEAPASANNDQQDGKDDDQDDNVDIDLDLGKKKKKKRKPFNMEELDGALPETNKEDGSNDAGANQDEGIVDDSLDLDLQDLIKTKKKKKKKKDLDELMAEEEEKQENKENGT